MEKTMQTTIICLAHFKLKTFSGVSRSPTSWIRSDRGVRKGFPEGRIQLHGGQLRGVIR